MVDDDDDPSVAAVKELEVECGMTVSKDELVDLTELACQEAADAGHLAYPGVAPAAGTSDEMIRYYYVEKVSNGSRPCGSFNDGAASYGT